MNGPEHYREAERRLLMAWEEDRVPEDVAHLVAEAQVHATLAQVAATADLAAAYSYTNECSGVAIEDWAEVLGKLGGEADAAPDSEAKVRALSASPKAWARLGRELRERREAVGLSRRALAEKAGVSEKAIQVAEEGRVPSARWPQSIGRVSRALGWSADAATQIVLTECPPEVTR
jgi:DNA-binding XRE family transcriptional regulator